MGKALSWIIFFSSIFSLQAEPWQADGCFARCEDEMLSVGDQHFPQSWQIGRDRLVPPPAFRTTGKQWLRQDGTGLPCPSDVRISGVYARRSAVGEPGLRVEIARKTRSDYVFLRLEKE